MAQTIEIQCVDCVRRGHCDSEWRLQRDALFLWAVNAVPLRCRDYREDVMVAIGFSPAPPRRLAASKLMIRRM